MTKAQRAMAVAMIYPTPEPLGRGKKSLISKDFNSGYLSQARTVIKWARELADASRSADRTNRIQLPTRVSTTRHSPAWQAQAQPRRSITMLDPITGPLALEDIETTDTTELVKWAVLLQNAITARMLISMTPRSINHIADRCAEGWRMGTAVVTDSEGRAFVDLIGTTPGNTHIQGFADLVEQEPMSSAH